MFRTLLLPMLIAGLLVLAFLTFFVRSDSGGRRLCTVAQAVLQDVSGQQVFFGRCEVDPIGTHVSITDVRIGPIAAPMFRADRISAGIDQRGFFEGRIRIDDVEVVRPRITLDLSQPRARANLDRPAGAACLPDLGRIELGKANVSDGDLRIALPDGRHVAAQGLMLAAGERSGKLHVDFHSAGAQYADPAGETDINQAAVRGWIDLNAGNAQLYAVDVGASEGSFHASGLIDNVCHPAGSVNVALEADLAALHQHLLKKVENLAGKAAVQVALKFSPTTFSASGDAQVENSKVLGFAPGSFRAAFTATPQALDLTQLDLPFDSGKVRASAHVGLAAPYPLTADARMDNVVLGELLERLGTKDLPVQLAVSGRAHLSGPVRGREGLGLDVSLDAHVSEFGVFDRSFRRRRERGAARYVGLSKGTVTAAFRIGNHGLQVAHAHIEVGAATRVDVSGLVSFDTAEGLRLKIDSSQLRLDDLGPFGPAVCRGSGEVHGQISGPYHALAIAAGINMRGLHVQGYGVGDVAAQVHLNLGDDTLDASNVRGTLGQSSFSGDGRLTFTDESVVQAHLWLDDARAIDLIDATTDRFPGLKHLDGNVDGRVTGDVEVRGPVRQLDLDARLALKDVVAYGQRFDDGTIRTSLRDGDALQLDTFDLRRGAAHLRLRGDLGIDAETFHLDAVTDGLQMSQLDPINARFPGSTGGVALKIAATGTIDHPRAQGQLLIRDWRHGDQPMASVQLALALKDTVASVDGTITSPWTTSVAEPDVPPGAAWPEPPGSMHHTVHATLDLAGSQPFDVAMNLDVPDARTVLKPGAIGNLHAGLSGTFTAQGDLDSLADTVATLEVPRLWIQYRQTTLEIAHPAVARLAGRRLVLEPLALRGPSFELDASGAREPDGRLDFSAQGTLDLSILSELMPDLEEAAGGVRIDLRVNGTQAAPVFVGNARLDGVALRLKALPVELTAGAGTVTFGRNVVIIDELSGQLNGGPVSATGELHLDAGYEPGQLNLAVTLGEIPLRWDDTRITFSGAPLLTRSSARDRFQLGGGITIDRLRFTRDLDLQRTLVEAVELARRPPMPRVLEREGEFLNLGMQIHLGDVQIDNNLCKAKLEGDLELAGTNRHPGLLGTVTVTDGQAFIRSNKFVVSSGVINFTDPSSMYKPTFDVRADAQIHQQVRDFTIHVDATGTPQQQHLEMTSDPPLSQADIVTLLTLGVVTEDFAANSTAASGILVDAAYNASGIPDQLKQLLPKNDLLKDPTFRVTSNYNPNTGNVEPYAELSTKFLRDDLTLQGATSLVKPSSGRQAQLQLQLRKNFDARVQWDDDPSAPSTGDIGGDLHFHWDAP